MENISQKQSDPPKRLKSDTRQWNSGRVMFAVIGWKDKPEKNYIIFEKNFFGKSAHPDQKFILRTIDWQNLKKLVDGELNADTQWERQVRVVDQSSLTQLLNDNPEVIEKVLSNPNILKLNDSSLEALDRLAVRLFEIKTDKIDLIIKELTNATGQDLDTFSDLLEDLRLHQVSMMASLVYQKLKVIDLLEKTCCDDTKSEKDVHRIFEKNIWLVGKNYEIVQSDRSLSQYLETNLTVDPETRKRPDLIIKVVPNSQDIVLIELKGPGIKLKAKHIGQVLEYKALIERNKPNVNNINCFLYGYEKDTTFLLSKDAEIKTFSELVSELRSEYQEYQRIIEEGKEVEEMPVF
jgi:hypothetical protein